MLRVGHDQAERRIAVATPAWLAWLTDPANHTFAFAGPEGSFTARREQRRGGEYWYAYRALGGRLRKRYLGRAADLTASRLAAVAAALADRAGESTAPATPQDTAPVGVALPLLTTKLYRPPPPASLVARPALRARVQAGSRGALTLLAAPAGFGKTTVLSDWVAHAGPPVAWLALDAGDNDPARFLAYLVAALQTRQPGLGASVLAALGAPGPLALPALLTLLLNDLTTRPVEVMLVLDDYHVIDAAPVHQALAFLLDHRPPHLRLIIASRADPPLPLARLRARGQLTELRADDLRYTPDEMAVVLTRASGLALSADQVTTLAARTEGWPAGLHLAALALRDRPDVPAFIAAFAGSHRYVLDYLVDEVLDRQTEAVRAFLLQTAVLDRLCGPLCDAITDRDDSRWQLDQLARSNLFIVPLDDVGEWWRYHHLFADVLRHHLHQTRPDGVSAWHGRAAAWFEQAGLLPEAVAHALAAADHPRAARLVEAAAQEVLWRRGEGETLAAWLEALPAMAVRARPRLGLLHAWVLIWTGRQAEAEQRLDQVEQALADDDPAEPPQALLAGELLAVRAELARFQSDMGQVIALADAALHRLPAGAFFPRGMATASRAGANYARGEIGAACQGFAEAVDLLQAAGQLSSTVTAAGWLVRALGLRGDLHEAARRFEHVTALIGAQAAPTYPLLGVALIARGDIRREWNDLDGAVHDLEDGIARCSPWDGVADAMLEGLLSLARVALARGDLDGALALVERAADQARTRRIPEGGRRVAATRARLWLARGELASAARWAAAHVASEASAPTLAGSVEHLLLARVLLAQGQPTEALVVLARLRPAAEVAGRHGQALEALILQALAHWARGETAQATLALAEALARAEPQGYLRLFVDEGPPMAVLLRRAADLGVAPAYVGRLLSAFPVGDVHGSFPESPDSRAVLRPQSSVLAEPLTARERVVLTLLAAGLSNRQIAAELAVSASTIKTHTEHLYRKLNARNRVQAAARAQALGLLP